MPDGVYTVFVGYIQRAIQVFCEVEAHWLVRIKTRFK